MFRLSAADHSLLTDTTLTNLKKMSADSVLDFLDAKTEDIVRHTGLPYSQIGSIKEGLLSKYAPKATNALELTQEWQDVATIIPTGINNLDTMLGGGLKTGSIYELCGLSSTGKSQICMTAVSHTINSKEAVLYIDTKRDLSIQRMVSILSAQHCENIAEALINLQVARPDTPYHLLTVLHDCIDKPRTPSPRIVIIDSLAGLFLQLLADQTKCLSLLSNTKSLLNYIAQEMHVVVLLTNVLTWHSEESEDENVQLQKAALGKFWSHAPTTRINTSRLNANQILLSITKSSHLVIGTSSTVTITENGVV